MRSPWIQSPGFLRAFFVRIRSDVTHARRRGVEVPAPRAAAAPAPLQPPSSVRTFLHIRMGISSFTLLTSIRNRLGYLPNIEAETWDYIPKTALLCTFERVFEEKGGGVVLSKTLVWIELVIGLDYAFCRCWWGSDGCVYRCEKLRAMGVVILHLIQTRQYFKVILLSIFFIL